MLAFFKNNNKKQQQTNKNNLRWHTFFVLLVMSGFTATVQQDP